MSRHNRGSYNRRAQKKPRRTQNNRQRNNNSPIEIVSSQQESKRYTAPKKPNRTHAQRQAAKIEQVYAIADLVIGGRVYTAAGAIKE